LRDPDILELAARIELVAHPDFAESFPKGTPSRVIMDQGEGPESHTVLFPLGDVANPMSRQQVTDKFRLIGAESLSPVRQDAILKAVDSLTTEGFAPLFAILGNACDDVDRQKEGELA
jgi:2-methylcitrate dehydratase PrpD